MADVTAMLQKPLCGNQMNLATLILIISLLVATKSDTQPICTRPET